MRIILLGLGLAVAACSGAAAERRDDDRRFEAGSARCPAPAGARPVDEATIDPAGVEPVVVSAWDNIPPSDQARLVQIVVDEQPDVRLNYLAELDGTLIIGVAGQSYCGGAYPPPGQVDVALPPHEGPIEIRTCFYSESECPPDLP